MWINNKDVENDKKKGSLPTKNPPRNGNENQPPHYIQVKERKNNKIAKMNFQGLL